MTELIITEKPSSAEKVAFALAEGKPVKKKNKQCSYFELKHADKDIIVTSAVGHLYGLSEKNKGSWTYPVFDIVWEPTYKTSKEAHYVKDYIDTITMLSSKADEFTIACDYDVEGEVIGLNVVRFACKKKDAHRMKFSTLTKGDLVEAYEQKMDHLDWGQANAGETRHKLDWFYGINLSRALTSSVKAAGSFKVMSIGRVQGPALKMLVDREKEIQAFKPEPFWRIRALHIKDKIEFESWHQGKIESRKVTEEVELFFKNLKEEKINLPEEIKNKLFNIDAIKQAKILIGNEEDILKELNNLSKEVLEHIKEIIQDLKKLLDTDKVWEKEKVKEIYNKIKDAKEATIQDIQNTIKNHSPPTPFNLTDLQSEAYALFKITPKETLALAQNLYLAGVTSYPRTSSQQLDPKLGFRKILADLSKQPMYQMLAQELLKAKELKPNNGKKTDPAHPAIYPTGQAPGDLKPREQRVYDLIVKRFMATFAKPAVRETMTVKLNVKGEVFIERGTRTMEENWHVFSKPYLKVEEITLPAMKKGEKAVIDKIEKHDEETQPPSRYNQSSIIKELEKRNLGTKATRAEILDTLFRRGYAEGVKITTTKLGMETEAILEKYAPTIVDEKLTADFEGDMEKIREGTEKPDTVLEKAKKFLTSLLTDFKKKEKAIGQEIILSIRETSDAANFMGICPNCKEGKLMVRRGKFGRFVGCDKYPDCKTIFNVPKAGMLKYLSTDEKTNTPRVEVGSGRSKQAVTLQQANQEDKTKTENQPKKYPEEGMTCPTCNQGKMVLRKSFYGEFLGCNNYPKCQTMMKIVGGIVDVKNPVVKNAAPKVEVKSVASSTATTENKDEKKVKKKTSKR